MVTNAQRLAEITSRLAATSETPRLDAELLLAHALGCTRSRLLARLHEPSAPRDLLEPLVARRLNHEPIAYILGVWEFFSLEFAVRAPVLVPRPETEHLVEAALRHMAGGPARVLDLCTGSGCVAVSLAKNAPGATVTAVDIAQHAAALARENAQRHAATVEVYVGDLFDALPPDSAPFDVIVSNPPYVAAGAWPTLSPVITRHEDPGALLAGDDGLDLIRRIVDTAPRHLRPGGLLALEMGEEQAAAVGGLLAAAGFVDIRVHRDLAGHDRIATGLRGAR